MRKTIDRTGERGVNNFGSEIVIVEYRNVHDIDVYFPQYDWTAKNKDYSVLKKGNIKCPYERTIYGIGYIGEGKYKVSENGKLTKVYQRWYEMVRRCYDSKYHKKYLTYTNCEVDEKWLNFQNFGTWHDENYYKIEGEKMELDKDILVKHNKIYSPETCVYVPQTINKLFVKRQNDRGESVIGTSPTQNGKYQVRCNLINPKTGKSKNKYLGVYETQEKAFEVYKYYKERNIKEIGNYYKEQIPQKLYDALYDYEVEIDD